MLAFFDFLRSVMPALLGFGVSALVEWGLFWADRTFRPLWRPSMIFVTVAFGVLVWSSWRAMTPMETLLGYRGSSEGSSLLVSISLFSAVMAGLLAFLSYSAIKQLVTEHVRGSLPWGMTLLRVAPVLVAFYMGIGFLHSVFFGPIVPGGEGSSLVELVSAEEEE